MEQPARIRWRTHRQIIWTKDEPPGEPTTYKFYRGVAGGGLYEKEKKNKEKKADRRPSPQAGSQAGSQGGSQADGPAVTEP